MLNTLPRRRGRPQACYRCADSTVVLGLQRRPDGRWRISATGETFTEPDEQLAVLRFRKIVAAQENQSERLPVDTEGLSPEAVLEKATTTEAVWSFVVGEPARVHRLVDEDEFWAAVRKAILERPAYVAQKTGIEQIAYLADLPKPTPPQDLAELGELYADKPGLSPNEASRSRLYWREFIDHTGATTVPQVTHDSVIRYEKAIHAEAYASKSTLHRYRKIRTIFAYAIKRGRSLVECRRALDVLAMLEVKSAHPLNPRPIPPATFWAIHAAAVKEGDRVFAALLLMALNACMYSGEVAALKWREIDLKKKELATERPKTDVSRIASLWPETVSAVRKLPSNTECVFNTSHRSYTTFSVLEKFRRYREAAEVADDITFSMIRDAAFSIACTNGSLEAAKALAGHRLPGVTDFYLKRNVRFVTSACDAVRAEFFQKKPAKKASAKKSPHHGAV